MNEALWLAGSYLSGSIPYALLIGLARGRDIRREGSGNPGATNLGRVLGRPYGVLAFVLDFAKGFAPVALAIACADRGDDEARGALLASGAAISAVIGHVFPIWLRFRGGKGVATAFGGLVALAPLAALVSGSLWVLVFLATRTVSIASLVGAVAGPIAVALDHLGRPFSTWWSQLVVVSLAATLIFVRHRSNIARLWRGEELGFRRGARKSGAVTRSATPTDATPTELAGDASVESPRADPTGAGPPRERGVAGQEEAGQEEENER